LRSPAPSRLARLEEGDDLPIDVRGLLDEDEVAGVFEDAQLGTRDRFGEGGSVSDGHVAILGAVDLPTSPETSKRDPALACM
jgi:hypothetical protein